MEEGGGVGNGNGQNVKINEIYIKKEGYLKSTVESRYFELFGI